MLALGAAGYGALAASTSRSQLARAVTWGESDVGDYARFPARRVTAAPSRVRFHRPPGGSLPPLPLRTVRVLEGGRPVQRDLLRFLAQSDTTAFLVLRGERLLDEGSCNGYHHNATPTSMSIAKSVLGALVGIAIDQGRSGSADDPITRYVPQLRRRDRRFGRITLRHLLTQPTPTDQQAAPPAATTPPPTTRPTWAAALRKTQIVEAPGRRFPYNNYNPLLVGLALERATGTPVARYLEHRLWQPLGMEAKASWSLDSRQNGCEKMESGLNARAVDFAKLGVLYAGGGAWQARQLVPRAWVQDPTVVPSGGGSVRAPAYRYFWWAQHDRRPSAVFARGKYGQHIYVVAKTRLVLVRFGRDSGDQHWPQLLSNLARQLDEP
ncbi:MAG TPA: serine hydrolase [Actinomycetes bacterium]|nr:serine hydrolase [Actinomycetes bacterium]